MLVIEIELLTGRYVASAHNDRTAHEWPPHPARVFSALVATWADAEEPSEEERAAITWLETLGDPHITASAYTYRTPVTHFVPINDTSVIRDQTRKMEKVGDLIDQIHQLDRGEATGPAAKQRDKLHRQLVKQRDVTSLVAASTSRGKATVDSAVELFPNQRSKQARYYPSVTPDSPVVTYCWPQAAPTPTLAEHLDHLLERVVRIGHSSSLVSCRLGQAAPEPSLIPVADRDRQSQPDGPLLRSVRPGQLRALEHLHARHQASTPRTLPATGVHYRPSPRTTWAFPEPIRPTRAGDWQVIQFAQGSRGRPMTTAVAVASALRGAILSYANDPIPEGLSGHQPDGTKTPDPHVAFVPLPFVGHRHATGALLGAALIFPAGMSPDDPARRATFQALVNWEAATRGAMELQLGRRGVVALELTEETTAKTLWPSTWGFPTTTWVSATPVALSRHPGSLRRGSPARRHAAWERAHHQITNECHHVGLPAPTDVQVRFEPFVAGARSAAQFPAFRQPGAGGQSQPRVLVHTRIEFDHPVQGPLLLGAGRFFGLGLMRPVGGGR